MKKPVVLNVKNDWWYTNLAALFDREDLYQDIIDLRQKYGISRHIPYKDVLRWFNELIAKETDPDLRRIWKINETGEYLYCRQRTSFESEINKLRNRYYRPEYFFTPIMYAVLCNKVTDISLTIKTANAFIMDKTDRVKEPKILISISPYTTLKQLVQAYKNDVPKLREEYLVRIAKQNIKITDVKPSIREHRKWYWMHVNNHSYQDIANMFPGVTRQSVINAIKDYKNLIN